MSIDFGNLLNAPDEHKIPYRNRDVVREARWNYMFEGKDHKLLENDRILKAQGVAGNPTELKYRRYLTEQMLDQTTQAAATATPPTTTST